MDCDVLIIGARVAGASLALLLGQRGHAVVLADRDGFPSDTLSTHFIGGGGVDALRRLGVLPEVEAAGFRRVTRTRTWVEDCLFEGPAGPPGVYGLAPRRDALDAILLRHAQQRGAAVLLDHTSAERLIEVDGRVVGAVLRGADGQPSEARARVVVGADGKYSKVAEWVKAETYEAVPALRPVYYGYYHGVQPLPEPAVELLFANNQIGFLFPMRPDEDCLALEIQPESFAAFRADPQAAFEQTYRALPGMAARMADARLEGTLQGSRGIENYLRKPYGPGWALTGDAGYLKDPCTGLGIGDALSQAFLLADTLDATLRGADWEASMSGFQQRRDAYMLPSYRFTLGAAQLRDAPQTAYAWLRGALINPHFARQIFYWLPTALADGLPPQLEPVMRSLAQVFGAQPPAQPPSGALAAAE
ncbi:MAG TPA: NAD(P)/FAD-dependent oxidoreductase [Ktedonobacterales bacterium]|nr:NAD(P)/FAD-dependent oxidoreductase [Ktedonobacterales bacterium]